MGTQPQSTRRDDIIKPKDQEPFRNGDGEGFSLHPIFLAYFKIKESRGVTIYNIYSYTVLPITVILQIMMTDIVLVL